MLCINSVIGKICDFHTILFNTPADNCRSAGILLPTSTKGIYSPDSCKVSATGILKYVNNRRPLFIGPEVVEEMNDSFYRASATANGNLLRNITFDIVPRSSSVYNNSLSYILCRWCNALPRDVKYCRFVGGDILNTKMLLSFMHAATLNSNKVFIATTFRTDILNSIWLCRRWGKEGVIPDNVRLFQKLPNPYSTELILHDFPTVDICHDSSYPREPEFVEGSYIYIDEGESNHYIRTRKPKWKC